MNDKKDPPKKALPGSKRRPPASLFLWLLAFLVLASLIVFNSSPYFTTPEEWTANTFLSHLEKGEIVYVSEGREQRLPIASGFVEVRDNQVDVCVEV